MHICIPCTNCISCDAGSELISLYQCIAQRIKLQLPNIRPAHLVSCSNSPSLPLCTSIGMEPGAALATKPTCWGCYIACFTCPTLSWVLILQGHSAILTCITSCGMHSKPGNNRSVGTSFEQPELSIHALSMQAFKLRVRPALDTVESGMDRIRMNIYRKCAQWGIPCPLTGAPSQHGETKQHASSPASA